MTRKILVSFSDGQYYWMDPTGATRDNRVIEIPAWRYRWLRVASMIERIVQRPVGRYLAGLDNDRDDRS
jgi:hypothetical protein